MNSSEVDSHQQRQLPAGVTTAWPEHLPDHAGHLQALFKTSLLALASGDHVARQSALDQFNQCSKALAQRLVRTVAAIEPPEPGSKQAIQQEITALQHHIHHQRQTIASTRARLASWYTQLAAQSDLAHDVIEARAYGGTLPPGIGIGSQPPSNLPGTNPTGFSASTPSSSAQPSSTATTATTPADGTAATSAATSATASMSAADTSDSKPDTPSALGTLSDMGSSNRPPTDLDDDQSSAFSAYPSSSGADALLDDESSLPPDWEERDMAELAAAAAARGNWLADRRSSLSGFLVEDEDTAAPSAAALDSVSGISDVVMGDVEQDTPAVSGPSETTGVSGAVGVSTDADDMDSISLSGLGSEIPVTGTAAASSGALPAPTTHPVPTPSSGTTTQQPPLQQPLQHPAQQPSQQPPQHPVVQQPLQHPAHRVHQHPFSTATAFLQGDSDSSSEEDDDD